MAEPFDMVGWIAARLLDTGMTFDLTVTPKVDDGLLHPSSHLGCEIAMCHSRDPAIGDAPKDYANLMRLMTGTLWHAMMDAWWRSGPFDGYEARTEVSMRGGMPKGWNGTADLLLGKLAGHSKYANATPKWQLWDYKTIAPNAMRYLDLEKPKEEHQWQTSFYWWAATALGYDLEPWVAMLHIPLAPAPWGVKMEAIPMVQRIPILPKDQCWKEAARRSRILKAYLAEKQGESVNPAYLPKEMPLVHESKLNKKTGLIEEALAPHWLRRYCNSPICACAHQERTVVAYRNPDEQEVL